MAVPSAEVTVLMGSTFPAVVLRQAQDIEEAERQLGSYGRHSHTSRCASSPSAPASTSQTDAPMSAGVPKTVDGGTVRRAASRPSTGRPAASQRVYGQSHLRNLDGDNDPGRADETARCP